MRQRPSLVLAGALLLGLFGCRETSLEPPRSDQPEVRWEIDGRVVSRPLIVDSLVVAAFWGGRLAAFSRATGSLVWERDGLEFEVPRLLHSGDQVLVDDLLLSAFDAHTGAPRWSAGPARRIPDRHASAMLSGTTVYTVRHGSATALNATTGDTLWSTALRALTLEPTLSERAVLIPVQEVTPGALAPRPHVVIALDRASGAELWRTPLHDTVSTLPFLASAASSGVVVGDRYIIGTRESRVIALRLSDGSVAWNTSGAAAADSLGYLPFSPVQLAGSALLVRFDGVLQARSPASGAVQWELPGFQATSLWPHRYAPAPCAPYLCTTSDGRLTLIEPGGRIAWQLERDPFTTLATPTVDDEGTLYVLAGFAPGVNRLLAIRGPLQPGATP